MRLQELLHGILPLWDTPACSWKRRKKEDRHEGGKWLKEIITLNPSHQHKQLVTQRAELPLIATQFCFFFKATHNFKQITDNIQLISLCFDVLRFAFTQIWRVGRYLLTHMQMDSQVKQRCSILLDNWCRWGNVLKNKKVKKKNKKKTWNGSSLSGVIQVTWSSRNPKIDLKRRPLRRQRGVKLVHPLRTGCF